MRCAIHNKKRCRNYHGAPLQYQLVIEFTRSAKQLLFNNFGGRVLTRALNRMFTCVISGGITWRRTYSDMMPIFSNFDYLEIQISKRGSYVT